MAKKFERRAQQFGNTHYMFPSAIPVGVRWLFGKRATAMSQLKRAPDHEELILEYKGLLKSGSEYKTKALDKYR